MNHKYIVPLLTALLCMVFIVLCLILTTPARAYEGPRITTAKQDALHEAAERLRAAGYGEDTPVLQALSEAWWREQEDLDIIAKVIRFEADPEWCEWEHSVAVGAVVMNRVRSPFFPDSVREVVAAPGQYLETYTCGFDQTPRLCYEAAKAVLDGDHDVPEDCYWQDTHVQGTAIWKAFVCDTGWFRSVTYICRGIPGVS